MSEHEHVRAFGGPFCAVCGVHIGFPAEPSPSRARPSDRAIAQAFWHAADFPLVGLHATTFTAAVMEHARNLDTEARVGDCWDDALDAVHAGIQRMALANGWDTSSDAMAVDFMVQTLYRTGTTKATP